MKEHSATIAAGVLLLMFAYFSSPPMVCKCMGKVAWERNARIVTLVYAPLLFLHQRVSLYRDALASEGRLLGVDGY